MSEESDLWKRTIVQLEYSQLLMKECTNQCNKAMKESQNALLLLEKVRMLRRQRTTIAYSGH